MEKKVSVIIPVYNVEAYLERCVKSVCAQSLQEIEIILVDDGSTDRSGRMCDEYQQTDPRIRVIHKENGGLTSAWKTGVLAAAADYVGFVDSDDWIDADMFERLYHSAVSGNTDIQICGLVYEFENQVRENKNEISSLDKELYTRAEIEQELFPVLLNDGTFFGRSVQAARVTKLYKKERVLDNLSYCSDDISVGEDLQLLFAVIQDVDRIGVCRDFYPYHYWINEHSITGKHDPAYLDKIKATREQLEYIGREKGRFDFSPQITADFLSLVVMAIKNEICKNKAVSGREVRKGIKKIWEDEQVKKAVHTHQMDRLMLSVRVYIMLLNLKLYLPVYWLTKWFFND